MYIIQSTSTSAFLREKISHDIAIYYNWVFEILIFCQSMFLSRSVRPLESLGSPKNSQRRSKSTYMSSRGSNWKKKNMGNVMFGICLEYVIGTSLWDILGSAFEAGNAPLIHLRKSWDQSVTLSSSYRITSKHLVSHLRNSKVWGFKASISRISQVRRVQEPWHFQHGFWPDESGSVYSILSLPPATVTPKQRAWRKTNINPLKTNSITM